MTGVNLDLLRALAPCHPDGRPKDPHAHHRAAHLAAQGADRALRRHLALKRFFGLFRRSARSRKASVTVA